MKSKGIRLLCVTVLLFALLYACTKSDSSSSGRGHTQEFVRTTLSGRVTDENKMPVTGADIKAGSTTATTDADGRFTISNVYVDKNAALIKVEKAGFFLGTKTIITDVDQNNPVTIQLIRKTVAGKINGASGGDVTVPAAGGTIRFEDNGIVNPADNKPYTGSVAVSAFFINPSADNFREIMPGTLRGITTGNEETGLQSFGMMAVELNGENGEKLQIAPGKTATLHFPITASLRSQAPATIPLWSLDETSGLWKEEGVATRQGDEYIGSVSHFSFWNCDAPFPIANFTVTVNTQQGQGLAGAEVVITAGTSDSTSVSGNGFSNADGVVKGTLPTNKSLLLKIYDKCHNLLHTKNIGPFTTSADLGVITLNVNPTVLNISGTAVNCNNAPLTNGYVLLELENLYYNIPVTNGSFNTTIVRCSNTATDGRLTAYDIANNISGSSIVLPVSGNTLQSGQLSACGTALDTYIDYTLDGIRYYLAPPADSLLVVPVASNSNTFAFGAFKQRDINDIRMFSWFSSVTQTGTYKMQLLYVMKDNIGYSSNSVSAVLTEYGTSPGTYIAGTFSGTVADTANNRNVVLPISCSFRLRR